MNRALMPRLKPSQPSTSTIEAASYDDSAATCHRSPRIRTASPGRSFVHCTPRLVHALFRR
jgi:hypothetical protein